MAPHEDPHDLRRFVSAQAATFEKAVEELGAGRKRSHWMWFIFPQLRGLGRSATAEYYGIASLAEARAYLAHPVLGERLRRLTAIVLALEERSPAKIFGAPDDLKFHSSMTLFSRVDGGATGVFDQALERFWSARRDERTVALLG